MYRKILNNQYGRLLIGILQVTAFVLLIRYVDSQAFLAYVNDLVGQPVKDETGHLTALSTLLFFVWCGMALALFVYFFRGLYKIYTHKIGPIREFNTDHAWAQVVSGEVLRMKPRSGDESQLKNINDTLAYIQAKNKSLPVDKAAENILSITGGLALASQDELCVIEGNLSRMSVSKGADYLMGRGKS